MKHFRFLRFAAGVCVSALILFSVSNHQCAGAEPPAVGTILSLDFNSANPWPQAIADAKGANAKTAFGPVGTIDAEGSSRASGGMLLSVEDTLAGQWTASWRSGPLAVRCGETEPGKLTLSFDFSASKARPVTVRVESLDASRKRTGGLESVIYPAAPDFYQRYALDFSSMKAAGGGKFNPADPFIQLSFEMSSDHGWPAGLHELRVDNVNYASPAFYVNPAGRDTNDGRTEKTAFATPQKALDAARPGDIVLLMDGIYRGGLKPVASFPRGGMPAAWIVLKNYPGQKPTLTSTGWNIVNVARGSTTAPSDDAALCYLEIRGLHVRGEGDVAKEKYPDAMDRADSRTNSNGIAVDGRYMKHMPHHIRIADNVVEYCPGCGIGTLETDRVTIENNVTRCNSWTTIYATSGISNLGCLNFDATDNVYKILIRNNVSYRNETYLKWHAVNRISDGNGIIVDINQKTDTHPDTCYIGRTLVQSNLCFDNGGSGIHTVRADRVDIINNTAYLNSASSALEYGQIYAHDSDDVNIINNILVAPVANTAAGEKPEPVNGIPGKSKKKVVFSHNLYFGGNIPPLPGDDDQMVDPEFVNPSRDPQVADFHLKQGSLAIGTGCAVPFSPILDADGKGRGNPPSKGAYEK